MNNASQHNIGPVCNLIGLITAGISVCWWVLYFTDFFPVFGGLLGLTRLGWWMGYAPCRATLLVDCLETTGGHFMEIREFNPKAPLEPEPVKRLTLSPRGTAKVLLATP
jgi:hypothetical protein